MRPQRGKIKLRVPNLVAESNEEHHMAPETNTGNWELGVAAFSGSITWQLIRQLILQVFIEYTRWHRAMDLQSN